MRPGTALQEEGALLDRAGETGGCDPGLLKKLEEDHLIGWLMAAGRKRRPEIRGAGCQGSVCLGEDIAFYPRTRGKPRQFQAGEGHGQVCLSGLETVSRASCPPRVSHQGEA